MTLHSFEKRSEKYILEIELNVPMVAILYSPIIIPGTRRAKVYIVRGQQLVIRERQRLQYIYS